MLYKNQLLRRQLVAAGYTQQINQALRNFLRDEGYVGSLNSALNKYLAAQGYTGHFVWKVIAWWADGYPLAPSSPDIWIMETGSWNDSGVWKDTSVWID